MSNDDIFDDVTTKTLKDILKEEGRTQVWLRGKLKEKGITRDKTQISQYCNNKYEPRDEYVLQAIADILGRELTEIKSCFN